MPRPLWIEYPGARYHLMNRRAHFGGQATSLDKVTHRRRHADSCGPPRYSHRRSCWQAFAVLFIERRGASQLMLTVVFSQMTLAIATFLGSLPFRLLNRVQVQARRRQPFPSRRSAACSPLALVARSARPLRWRGFFRTAAPTSSKRSAQAWLPPH